MPQITLKPNNRLALIGKTGSGKSFWAEHTLLRVKRLVVADPKHQIITETDKWRLSPYNEGIRKLHRGMDARLIINPRDEQEWENLFDDILRTKNVLLYLDEMYEPLGPKRSSPGLKAAYTMGRSMGIGTWGCMQRPKWVPLFALSEAETIVQFELQHPDDKKFMYNFIGQKAYSDLAGHKFVIYQDGRATLYNPLRVYNSPTSRAR